MKYNFSSSKKTSKLLSVAFLSIGITSAVALPVTAGDVVFQGNFCQPIRKDIAKIERTQYGVHNTSASVDATVQCPFFLPFDNNLRVNRVFVAVYDRNPSTNINCALTGVDVVGNAIWTLNSSSSGSQAGNQFLSFSPPNAFIATMSMSCSLPASTSSGISHIATYRAVTIP